MTKKYEDDRTEEQRRGAAGRCDTVTLKSGTVMNAHEYDEKKHGPMKKHHKANDSDGDGDAVEVASSAPAKTDWEKKTKEEMKDALAEVGVSFDVNAKHADLVALCVKQFG